MNLYLDTDIGSDVDDVLALALILGSPEFDLAGISTVYGDTLLRARLARRYLGVAGGASGVPVFAAISDPRSGREVWWAGHEGALFPDLDTESISGEGIDHLLETVALHPGEVDVLAIGPLTDIAAALDADPLFEAGVRRLTIMGGDFGNGRISEHNIRSDVAAAQRVFDSGLDLVVGGLDLTTKVRLGRDDVARIARAGAFGEVIAEEIGVWWTFNDEDGNTPHDATVALSLAVPSLFRDRRARVTVDDNGYTFDTPDDAGPVRILDTPSPDAIREQIVRRIVAAASDSTLPGKTLD